MDNAKQFDGAVNKIAVGGDKSGEVNAQISICDIDGVAAYTKVNYKLLNVPILENGASGVRIDGNGYLTVSNSLPQWTAFAVEVNVGRVQYGDIVLDGGVSKVINFLIYVDVEDIKILDEENRVVYYIDVAPKQTVNLTAVVFPSHAFKAASLTYEFLDSDGSKYVELKPDGYNAEVTVLPTAPNKTYVRIVAKCGDEFAVVITVRVSAKVINAASSGGIYLNDSTKSAYEIVLNSEIVRRTITVPAYVDYLKIRKGSGNVMTSVAIKVESDNLTLVLESVELHGIINAKGHNLDLHFIGDVKLYGASGSYYDGSADGESVISASNLKITKADNHWVEITAGNGYSSLNSEKRVGNGGNAGAGGDGGNGGHGGEGGDDTNWIGQEGPGGRGGNGGNAGSAGDVGSQGGFVTIKDFNDQDYYNMIAADGFEALRGYMGLGGAGGRRGDKGGSDAGVEDVAESGSNGSGRVR